MRHGLQFGILRIADSRMIKWEFSKGQVVRVIRKRQPDQISPAEGCRRHGVRQNTFDRREAPVHQYGCRPHVPEPGRRQPGARPGARRQVVARAYVWASVRQLGPGFLEATGLRLRYVRRALRISGCSCAANPVRMSEL